MEEASLVDTECDDGAGYHRESPEDIDDGVGYAVLNLVARESAPYAPCEDGDEDKEKPEFVFHKIIYHLVIYYLVIYLFI